MCMVDDAETFQVSHSATRIARKPHKCDECGREIGRGEQYECFVGKSPDGNYWDTFKTCAHCIWARRWLLTECNGWCFAGVYEDLLEHWEGELMRDLYLGRAIVGIRRKWQRRDGSLMAVPA